MERVPLESSQRPGPKRTLSLESLEPRLLLQADWTVMVYLDGDNNLEAAAVDDFLEMAHVGSTADVNVVAQFDRSPLDQNTGGPGYTNSYGDWSDTRRGLINKNDVPDTSWGTSIGEANMGDPNVLQAFLTWAMTNYQANHYAVILWDHGDGYKGVEYDDTDASYLTMNDVSSAMSGALTATSTSSFDLLNFDGCVMSMTEVAFQMKDVAGLMVASEDLVPLDGLPYDQVLGDLTAQPNMQPVELADHMAQDYLTYYDFSGTYSVVDETQMGPLGAALSNFATTFINQGTATDRYRLGQHWITDPWFADPDYLDVGVLMTDISGDTAMSTSVRNAADDVLAVYSDAIVSNYAGSNSFGGSGLSIYLPDYYETVDPNYNGSELAFASQTQWDEFLTWWTGTPEASWTFIVYMDGDNNLEQYAIQDFLEMASVGSNSAVNIVVQLDRAAGYDSSYGDWTDTRRGAVNQGDVPDATWGTSIGEADMGDPNTLSDFLTWAMTNYPAEHYAVTLWDHGGGLDGAMYDDNNGSGYSDHLTVAELDQGLQGAPDHIDVLRFDACEMSTLEVAYQLRNDADYMISSEDFSWLVTGEGGLTPYDQVLSNLNTNPSMSSYDLSNMMAQLYFQSWSVGNLTVMNQVTDLSRVADLANAMDNVAQTALTSGTTEDRILMDQYRQSSPSYPSDTYGAYMRDLGTWLAGVAGDANITPAISQAAADALNAYYSAVVGNYAAPGSATGLDIYMPDGMPSGTYNWQNFSFVNDTQWADFLNWWAANEVMPIAVYQSGAAKVSFFDVQGIQDIDPSDIYVKMSGTNVKSILLAGDDPMQGLGIVISGATSVGKIQDKRTAPGEIAFIASNTGAKSVQVNSAISGEWLNGRSLGGVIFPSDIDGDGNPYDTTSLYFGGGVGKLSVNGSIYGGALINGPVKSFRLANGDLWDDTVINGDAGKIQFSGLAWGYVLSSFTVNGDVKSLSMPDGGIMSEAVLAVSGTLKKADIGYIDAGSVNISTPIDDDSIATVPLASFDPSTVNFSYSRGATLQVGQAIGKITVGWFLPGNINYVTTSGTAGDTNGFVAPTDGTDQRYFTTYIMSNVLTPSIGKMDVLWGMGNARVLAGADLGADRLPGGTGANADTYGVGYIGQLRVGTAEKRAGGTSVYYVAGGPDQTEYGSGSVIDSLIGAGLFISPNAGGNIGVWGGSGYNLVTQHDLYLFEDGSYIGKVDVAGQIQSLYSEIEAAGNDFDTGTPPQYPYFVPFGIGSYEMGSVSMAGSAVSPVATIGAVGIWPRQPYLFVELPRGLGANG